MTSRHLAALPAALFSRHTGRHCRRRWAATAQQPAPAVDDFSQIRRPALAAAPVADDLIPFAGYRHPYSPKDAA